MKDPWKRKETDKSSPYRGSLNPTTCFRNRKARRNMHSIEDGVCDAILFASISKRQLDPQLRSAGSKKDQVALARHRLQKRPREKRSVVRQPLPIQGGADKRCGVGIVYIGRRPEVHPSPPTHRGFGVNPR